MSPLFVLKSNYVPLVMQTNEILWNFSLLAYMNQIKDLNLLSQGKYFENQRSEDFILVHSTSVYRRVLVPSLNQTYLSYESFL